MHKRQQTATRYVHKTTEHLIVTATTAFRENKQKRRREREATEAEDKSQYKLTEQEKARRSTRSDTKTSPRICNMQCRIQKQQGLTK